MHPHPRVRPIATVFLASVLAAAPLRSQRSAAIDRTPEIIAFNRRVSDATQRMDNAASLALWEDDGVSLLPSTKPIVGRTAIAAFLESATAPLKGATMETFDMRCFDIQVSGSSATEWCNEHQVITLADKTRFDGWGRIAYVLHRAGDGIWRIKQEMWNQGVPP
jgi:uncharacterized protein (TIGR02246 family)